MVHESVYKKCAIWKHSNPLYDKQQIFLNTCIRVSFKRVLLLRAWKNVDDHGYQWNNGQYVISLILSRSARKVSSSGSINLLCKLPCKISTVSAVLRCSDEVVNTTETIERKAINWNTGSDGYLSLPGERGWWFRRIFSPILLCLNFPVGWGIQTPPSKFPLCSRTG